MGKNEKKSTIFNKLIIHLLTIKKEAGITLVELLVTTVILGITAALVGPSLIFNDPSADAYTQTKGVVQQTRQRAISTTSAIRMKPDPSNPTGKLLIEVANTRGCEATTKLRLDAQKTDKNLEVYSAKGFQVGDKIKVGGDEEDNDIISIVDDDTITLGAEIDSQQLVNAPVELLNNWRRDGSLDDEQLSFPKGVQMSSSINNWTVCFNSRGVAYIFDSEGNSKPQLSLTLTSASNTQDTITILRGGAIATTN